MLRKSLLAVIAVSMVCFMACSGDKKKSEEEKRLIDPVVMLVTKTDTAEVLKLVQYYLECLSQHNYDEAESMLFMLQNDSLVPVPERFASRQRLGMRAFGAKHFEIDRMVFYHDNDCEVQYTATLFDKKEGDNRPNKLSFLLKPVRYQGRWYLTMADSDDRNTSRSKIRESQN